MFLLSFLSCWAQADGTRRWAFLTSGPVYSSPAVGRDGTIYVGSEGTIITQSRLYAIAPSGNLIWQFATGDWVDSTPAIGADGTIYFGSWDGKLYAVNPTDGSKRWEFAATGFIASSPAIGPDGTIYIGSGDRNLYAVNPTGTLKWALPVADWVDSAPAVGSDGTVYFGSLDDSVYAVFSDGTQRWKFTTGDSITSSPAIGSNGTIYIGSNDGKLYALNGQTGAKLWEFVTASAISASPVLGADGTVYFGGGDGFFYAVNGSTGALVWRATIGFEILSSAAVRQDGTIIFGASDKNVYALNPNGTTKWKLLTEDFVDSSPVIGADGMIYVGSVDKKLYALNGNGSAAASGSAWPMFRRDSVRNGRASTGGGGAVLPTITTQLHSQTVTTGREVTLFVNAAGTPPLSYQWRKNGVNVAGATNSSLVLSAVSSGDAATYTVVITNSAGSITSGAAVITVAPAFFPQPSGLALDSSGNIYVADRSTNTVQRVSTLGVITLVAGTSGSAGSTDGAGAAARFSQPSGVSSTSGAILTVADTGNATLRRITADGTVITLAGSPTVRGNGDATGTAASFSSPMGLGQDGAGTIFVADTMNHTIRRITFGGIVSTFAGSPGSPGSNDGTGTAARFNSPRGTVVDSSGNVYVADTTNNTIRRITAVGVVSTLAGLAGVTGTDDGTGNGALFNRPDGLATDAAGNIYVADSGNSLVRKISPAGVVTTLAGLPGIAGLLDGTGSGAFFNQPQALAVDSAGNVFVADTGNAALRRVTQAGVVTTVSLSLTAPPAPTPLPPPTPTPTPTPSGGGGGGAPSAWFLASLAALAIVRRCLLDRRST